ncbi:MAG: hypothetical protein ACK6A5_16320, partial [Flavobacteriales bacterium]
VGQTLVSGKSGVAQEVGNTLPLSEVPVATVASAVVLEEEIVVEVIAVETVATTKSHAATEA